MIHKINNIRRFRRFFQYSILIIAIVMSVLVVNGLPGSAPQVAQAQASRGATLPYVEIEAENAATNGTVIGPGRTTFTLIGESSNRRAVNLISSGQYVEFTLPQQANSIVVRYSIPDAAGGGGITAPLSLYINGARQPDLTLTSKWSWRYGSYQFSNNPGDGNPFHRYDEVNRLLPQMSAGAKVRLQVDSPQTTITIDLADFEQVAPTIGQPANSISVVADFGADPGNSADSTTAFRNAISAGKSQGRTVYIPPGTYRLTGQLQRINGVTIQGAGMWHSKLYFPLITGSNTVGVYGNYMPSGVTGAQDSVPSQNVFMSDFAIFGEVNQRVDGDQNNGIGGAFSNSTIQNIWIEHVKCGFWLDGPMDRLTIRGMRIRNVIADGLNFHTGTTNSIFTNSHLRNTGDDALAMWAEFTANTNNSFTFNTIQGTMFANDIAVYGGSNNHIDDNIVMDGTHFQGGSIHVANRFASVQLGGTTTVLRNTVLRGGDLDKNWQFGVGAIWLDGRDAAIAGTIRVENNDLIDNSYEALMFMGGGFSNVSVVNNRITGTGTFVLQIHSPGNVTFTGNVHSGGIGSRTSVGSAIYSCSGTSFSMTNGGGNSDWINDTPYCGPWPAPVYSPVATNTPTRTNTPCPGACPPTATNPPPPTNTRTPTFTPSPTPVTGTLIAAVNAGGAAVGSYSADTGFNQGNQFSDASTAIDTSGNLDPRVAPQGVYQSCRWFANFTWTRTGLTAGATYTVVLHWAELSFQAAGARTFNVDINGSRVLTNFDVFATAGFKKALGRVFTTTANASGQIVIAFSAGTADNPFISGIEILQPGNVPTATRTNTPSVPTNTPTRTNTPVGPTLTPTPTNTRTNTPVSGGDGSPWNGTPAAIPGTVQAENYNTGGEGVAYHDNDATNNGGQYRTTEGVDIEVTTDTGGGHNVGWASPGEWVKYTVNVATTGAYTLNFRVASGVATGAFALEVDGVNVTGTITVPNTGGWQTFQTITRTGINLTAGQHVLRLVISGDGVNTNWLQFVGSGGATNTPTRTNTPTSNNGSPWNGTPVALPGTVQAENYNTGGQNVAYNDLEAANQGGQYRTTEGVDIEVTTDTGGGYNVGWTRTGEWMKYTVNATTSKAYSIDFRVANGTTTGAFYLEVDGVNVTGTITVPNTGGWQTWQTITRTGINLTAGQHVIRLVITGPDTNINWIRFN